MARTYAKVYVSIWAGDFQELSIGAQGLYFRLLTDAKLTMCGVADWRPKRLTQSFKGMTAPALRALSEELERARYIVVDEDTEEVLIRSFVRHDGVLKSPNLTKAMAADWLSVTSQKIKNAIALEVHRAIESEPTLKGSGSVPDWFPKGSDLVPESTDGEPFQIGSDSVPAGFPYPATSNQQPTTTLVADAPAPKSRKKPATPFPVGWTPSNANVTYAEEHDIDWQHEAAQFQAHHLARDSRFANWDQAFRTWLGNAAKWRRPEEPRRLADDSWDHLKRDPDEDVA